MAAHRHLFLSVFLVVFSVLSCPVEDLAFPELPVIQVRGWDEHGVSILFYQGPPPDMEKLLLREDIHRSFKGLMRRGIIRFIHNSTSGVTAIVSSTGLAHAGLAGFLEDKSTIRGGTRYTNPKSRGNSATFRQFNGEAVQDEHFRFEIVPSK